MLTIFLQYPSDRRATVQVMSTEESTLESDTLTAEERWSYYVNAFAMRDPTEGVDFSQMRMPFLKRNLPDKMDEDEEYDRFYRRIQHEESLILRICANNYTILYEPSSADWFWRPPPEADKEADAETAKAREEELAKEKAALKEKRHDRFVEKFVNNPNWAAGLSKDKVDESNQRFRSWLNGTLSQESPVPAEVPAHKDEKPDEKQEEPADTEMAEAEPEPAATEA